MFTTEQINAIAQAVATAVTQVSQVNTEERFPQFNNEAFLVPVTN